MSDEQGEPLFFFRIVKSARIDIQFPSETDRRMPRALDEFTEEIKKSCKGAGFKEIIFQSTFGPLIRFLERRGFKSSPGEQIALL